MKTFGTRLILLAVLALPAAALPSVARAGEADDLQRIIEDSRNSANDLERLDEQRAVGDELTTLRLWLDNAWNLRSQEKYDDVRIITDRCKAQMDMIREKITASRLTAQAAAKESEVARAKATLERTKKALDAARLQKARLEGPKS